ncbi:FkbM family methyltransferase [Candidatus Pelagibacter ubique]|jgi:FkbM family methyltransferase|nr:FkbM family methyltransferase [Candidatus Pelagibacter ubique]
MKILNKIYLNLQNFYKKIILRDKYYSFSGVDIVLKKIFYQQEKGFYIDVGCQNPIKNNNTYLLYKKGWEGINIDLDKDNINLFNSARPKDSNFNKAISSDIKNVELYFYHKKSPINTIDKKTSDFQKAKVTSIKKINTDTLDNIVLNSKYKNHTFDLLSIDVEGHELDVLKGFDLDKYSPKVIVVEYLDLNVSKLEIKNLSIENVLSSEIYKYLISKNYILVNSIYCDLVFVNKSFRD